ncbi:kelch repeat-containing protein [Sorangium sp. So ce1078]|uniref:kelch repeat-containing protein n=1 Tax=Sorangium sp. So ce1078 TaxID=3133329 RepID=UPI003F5F0045
MPVAPMGIPRVRFTATLLPDGRVLAAGGSSEPSTAPLPTCEIYDPTTDAWSPASTDTWTLTAWMIDEFQCRRAMLLPSGKVLFADAFTIGSPISGAPAVLVRGAPGRSGRGVAAPVLRAVRHQPSLARHHRAV